MIRLLVAVELHIVRYHLFLRDILENQEVWLVFTTVVVVACWGIWITLIIEEALSTAMSARHRTIHSSVSYGWTTINWGLSGSTRNQSFTFIFDFFQFHHTLAKLSLSLLFLYTRFRNGKHSLSIDKVARSWSSSEFTIDTLPVLLEIRLDVLQSIQCRHFRWLLSRLSGSLGLCNLFRLRVLSFHCWLRCFLLSFSRGRTINVKISQIEKALFIKNLN